MPYLGITWQIMVIKSSKNVVKMGEFYYCNNYDICRSIVMYHHSAQISSVVFPQIKKRLARETLAPSAVASATYFLTRECTSPRRVFYLIGNRNFL